MALNLGLVLGAALSGAAEGGGGAAQDVLQKQQENQNKMDLMKTQNDLDTQREMALENARQGFQTQQQKNLFGHEESMQSAQFQFQGTQDDLNRLNELQMSKGHDIAEITSASMREQGEKYMADARVEADKEIAVLGHNNKTIQTDAQGRMWSIQNQLNGPPITTPVLGPDGKQLIGPKNVDQASLIQANSLNAQARMAEQNGDNKMAAILYGQASQILNNASGSKSYPAPSGKDIATLQAAAKNGTATPAMINQYETIYGPGAAQRDAGVGGTNPGTPGEGSTPAASATSTGTPGTPPLPGMGPADAGQVNRPALVAGNIPTATPTATPAVASPAVQGVPVNAGNFSQNPYAAPAPVAPATPVTPAVQPNALNLQQSPSVLAQLDQSPQTVGLIAGQQQPIQSGVMPGSNQ